MPRRLDSIHVALLMLAALLAGVAAWGWLRPDGAPNSSKSLSRTEGETSTNAMKSGETGSGSSSNCSPGLPAKDQPDQPSKPEGRADEPNGGGAIWGRVLNPDGTPAANIAVVATDSLLTRGRPTFPGTDYLEYARKVQAYAEVARRNTFRTSSGVDGAFRVEGLNVKRVYHVSAGNFNGAMAWATSTAPGTELELVLRVFPSLRGRVTVDGAPCQAFELVVVGPEGSQRPRADRRPFFGDDGRFELRMAEGNYLVWAEAEGMMSAQATRVKISDASMEISLSVQTAFEATLFVTDQNGVPLPGLRVNLAAGTGNNSDFARAMGFGYPTDLSVDTKGFARVRPLAAGRYKASVLDGNHHTLGSQEFDVGPGIQQADIRVNLGWSYSVGVVNDKNFGVEVGEMYLRAVDGGPEPVTLQTSTPGKRIFRRVCAGKYTLNIRLRDDAKVTREIEVSADGQSETVVLKARGRLKGHLVPLGQGIVTGCSLRLLSPETKDTDSGIVGVDPGPDGLFDLGLVETGNYTVVVRDPRGKTVLTQEIVLAEGVNERSFTLDTLASVRISLTSGDASIDLQRVLVNLISTSTERNTENIQCRNGEFQRGFLPPGEYLITMNDRTFAGSPRLVTLTAGISDVEILVGKPNSVVVVRTMAWREGEQVVCAGDLIVEFAGRVIAAPKDLIEARKELKGGEQFDMVVERDGKRVSVRLSTNDWFETAPAFRP